jgi:signal transduction histidine kinase
MSIESNCLECHGEPAGEPDVLGYPKEGWKIGDLAGAVSIVMPIDIYQENTKANVTQEVAFFFVLTLLFILLMYYTTAKLVTNPLQRFKKNIAQIKEGDLGIHFENLDAVGEIKELVEHFNDMAVQLNNLYTGLENIVEQRTEDLAKANGILESQRIQLEEVNRRLQEDNQYKSDFMAMMSHELRTPLTSIVAFAEVLEKNRNPRADKELRMVQEIKSNSQILLDMITNILEMARLEAGRIELLIEPLDLVDLINAVDGVVQPLAEKKKINYASSVERDVPLIKADKERLRQVVANLVSNAIKFTPEGGEIKAWVIYDKEHNEVIINVKDNGIGIRKEDQAYIFEKFVQSDSSPNRQYNGSGLGLALAKEFSELHGGWIKVQSELNKGSLFTVVIPAGKGGDLTE